MNRYRKMLKKRLYHLSLVLNDHGKIYYRQNLKTCNLNELAQNTPDFIIQGGSINGININVYRQDIGHTDPLTVKQLCELLPEWLNDNVFIPELYVVGGYYPTKDGQLIFDLQCPSHDPNNFYIWTKEPWTDMPIYRIDDTQFTRIKKGDLSAPAAYPIKTWFDNIIRRKIETNDLMSY